MTRRVAITGFVLSGLAALGPAAAGQMTILPGSVAREITSISDDGTRVIGRATAPHSYYWNAAGGYAFYDGLMEGGNGLPALSGDGRSLVSVSGAFDSTSGQAIVASNTGGVTVLPRVFSESAQSFPTSISRDGSVVCGWEQTSVGGIQAGWRWSASGGLQVLQGFSHTLSMSGDGWTIFGGNGSGEYGMWHDGVTTSVPGGLGRVQAVNYDGSIFAGDGWMWNHGQTTTVPLLPSGSQPVFIDMNEDGTVAVGTNSIPNGGDAFFVWTPSTGTQSPGAYFASYGHDLSGYRMTDVHVSATAAPSGYQLVKQSIHRYGVIMTVPCPSVGGVLLCLLVGRRKR